MSKLLSDEELKREVMSIYMGDLNGEPVYPASVDADKVVELFNTQKRLYAEDIIGSDERFTGNGDKYPEVRNGLRSEQRSRIDE